MSTATDREATAGHAPSSPEKLSLADWLAAFKRSFAEFMKDDCMGLAQQIAYSSLLAFFPAMAFLVGALGLFHLFDDVKQLLDPIAPNGVIKFITSLQQDSQGGTSAAAFIIGFFGAVWAASGAMTSVIKAVNRAYERQETRPFWKVRGIAILLVVSSGITTAGVFLLIVVGGALGDAISKKAGLGGAFQWVWGIARWPVAFCAILLFFGLVYYLAPNKEQRSWKWITPGSFVGGLLWLLPVGPLRALRHLRRELHEDVRDDRERRHPVAVAQLLGVRASLRRGAERGARPAGRHPRGRRRAGRAREAR